MADMKNWGEVGNTKIWIPRDEKRILDEIKNIFRNYLRAIIWWRNEKE